MLLTNLLYTGLGFYPTPRGLVCGKDFLGLWFLTVSRWLGNLLCPWPGGLVLGACPPHPWGASLWCPHHPFAEELPFSCIAASLTSSETNEGPAVSQKRAARTPAVRLGSLWGGHWGSLPLCMVLDTQCWSRAHAAPFALMPEAVKVGFNFISKMRRWFLFYSQPNCEIILSQFSYVFFSAGENWQI